MLLFDNIAAHLVIILEKYVEYYRKEAFFKQKLFILQTDGQTDI